MVLAATVLDASGTGHVIELVENIDIFHSYVRAVAESIADN